MTHRFYLNDDWLFTEQFEDSLAAPEYPENTLQPVRLPHTCKETPFHYFDESLYQMVSGYRRHLLIPKESQGKRILLTVEGAIFNCEANSFCVMPRSSIKILNLSPKFIKSPRIYLIWY